MSGQSNGTAITPLTVPHVVGDMTLQELVAAPTPEPVHMPAKFGDLDPEHREMFEAYTAQLQALLGLERWSLTVMWSAPAPSDCDAQVEVIDGRYAALMWLHDEFFTLPLSEQRRVVVHELLHLHTAPIISAVHITSKAITKPARKVGVKLIRDAEEHVVDALSVTVGELLPLPDWAEPPAPRRRSSAAY